MIKIFADKNQISQYFGEMLIDGISKLQYGQQYSIALSGGSTPKAIFDYLAVNFKDKIQWDKLLVFWGDERCVPPDDKDSNYKMAKVSLLDHVSIPAENIFRIKGEDEPDAEAKRYEMIIQDKIGGQKDSPQFDLVLLGLGTDGHTASIFPDSISLFDSDNLCDVVQHPDSGQTRITITGKIINQAKTAAFLATGEGKAEMVATVIDEKDGYEKLPSSKVQPEDGTLLWLLDSASAAKLKTIS